MCRTFGVEGVRNEERRSRGTESLVSRDGASDGIKIQVWNFAKIRALTCNQWGCLNTGVMCTFVLSL